MSRPEKPYKETGDRTEAEERVANRYFDDAFVNAMRVAIKSKQENPSIGVFKNPSPLIVKPLYGEPLVSGCGSSAALCADAAG